MRVLDQRRQIERRKQLAVAQRPVLAAAHPRAGDPDDGAENDEQVREASGGPGEPRVGTSHGRAIYIREGNSRLRPVRELTPRQRPGRAPASAPGYNWRPRPPLPPPGPP